MYQGEAHLISEKERIYLEYLVLHCQHRDTKAWEELIRLYEKRLFYFAKQMVGQHQDALNVMQETWMKVYRSIHRLGNPDSLTPWLYKIARNMSLKYLRSHRKDIFIDDCYMSDMPSQQEQADMSYTAERIHHGLQLLTHAHREALALFYLEDFSLQEIADILSVPIGTVRSRLHYAKRSLKAVLEKEKDNGTL